MSTPIQREHYLDYVRAALMLLGIPFHVSLIYSSHHWVVNSTPESLPLSLFNDFIHAFRMQVFFVISGYFSCMLYQRYPLGKWLHVRLSRLLIPMLTAAVLITLPQFVFILHHTSAVSDWGDAGFWQRINISIWYLVSHLWFLLTLSLITLISAPLLHAILQHGLWNRLSPRALPLLFILLGIAFMLFQKLCATLIPTLSGSAAFNFLVMNTLLYLPFYLLGGLAFARSEHKANLTRITPAEGLLTLLVMGLYLLNENSRAFGEHAFAVQLFLLFIIGLMMSKAVLTLGHRLLNKESRIVTYFVTASLFIYLVHHPLTIMYGSVTQALHIVPGFGFALGVTLVVAGSLLLYELHRRIPLLRYLFSGKPQRKPAATSASS